MIRFILVCFGLLALQASKAQSLSETSFSSVLEVVKGKEKDQRIVCEDLVLSASTIQFEEKHYKIKEYKERELSIFVYCEGLTLRLIFLNKAVCLVAIIEVQDEKTIRRYINQDKTNH